MSNLKAVNDLVQRAVEVTEKHVPSVTSTKDFVECLACKDFNRLVLKQSDTFYIFHAILLCNTVGRD